MIRDVGLVYHRPACDPPVRALTLLELLIVLTVLAVVTTMATRGIISVSEQSQFSANESLCKKFRLALLGPSRALQSDGTPSVAGFIADLGRPPRAQLETLSVGENVALGVSGLGTAYTARELMGIVNAPAFKSYIADSTTVTSATKSFSTFTLNLYDLTNRISVGWRGPYLTGGTDSIIDDGWNKPVAAYVTPANRNLVDFWVTSYDGVSSPVPVAAMNPFSVSTPGYHSMNADGTVTTGRFPLDLTGIILRPGAAAASGYGSSDLDTYTNVLSYGIVLTNEYTAQLACVLNYNQSAMVDPVFSGGTYNSSYWWVAGVIMYGANPFYGSTLYVSAGAITKPVAVSFQATGPTLTSAGPSTSTYPTAQTMTFTNSPMEFNPALSGTYSAAVYPLIQGPRVLKPFLIALRKSSGYNAAATVISTNWFGATRTFVVSPGNNSVQLTVP